MQPPTYDSALDSRRLGAQLNRVFAVMIGGDWLTLGEIAAKTGDPEASISARLRDLRKLFGKVERNRRGREDAGHWEYRFELHTISGADHVQAATQFI